MKSQEKTTENRTKKSSPENKCKNISSFNDGEDADLEEALRRSLADQSGSSQQGTSNGAHRKDSLKPEGSKASPKKARLQFRAYRAHPKTLCPILPVRSHQVGSVHHHPHPTTLVGHHHHLGVVGSVRILGFNPDSAYI